MNSTFYYTRLVYLFSMVNNMNLRLIANRVASSGLVLHEGRLPELNTPEDVIEYIPKISEEMQSDLDTLGIFITRERLLSNVVHSATRLFRNMEEVQKHIKDKDGKAAKSAASSAASNLGIIVGAIRKHLGNPKFKAIAPIVNRVIQAVGGLNDGAQILLAGPDRDPSPHMTNLMLLPE